MKDEKIDMKWLHSRAFKDALGRSGSFFFLDNRGLWKLVYVHWTAFGSTTETVKWTFADKKRFRDILRHNETIERISTNITDWGRGLPELSRNTLIKVRKLSLPSLT